MTNTTSTNNLPQLLTVPPYDDRGVVATVINELGEGRTNAFGTFTLDANAASTTFNDPNFNGAQYVGYWPLTDNAMAEIGAGTMRQDISGSTQGQFKIKHANNAQADRTFAYLRFG